MHPISFLIGLYLSTSPLGWDTWEPNYITNVFTRVFSLEYAQLHYWPALKPLKKQLHVHSGFVSWFDNFKVSSYQSGSNPEVIELMINS